MKVGIIELLQGGCCLDTAEETVCWLKDRPAEACDLWKIE